MTKIVLWSVVAVVAVLVIAIGSFLVYRAVRQGQVAKTLAIATPAGINEAMFVSIGGIDQWVQIRGEDRDNPVILVLHGGMAMSYMAFTPAFRAWEKQFTVVQWDRRGVGKTFGRNGGSGSGQMSLDRIIRDGMELSEFLRHHLHQDKIILLGHSMGSQIGVSMTALRPELFHAYVGSEQIIDMGRNEAVSYEMIRAGLKSQGDRESLAKLDRIGPPPYAKLMDWGVKQGLAERADPAYGRLQKDIGPMLLFNPTYSPKDLIDFVLGNQFSGSKLYDGWMAFDARKLGARFEVPIIIIQGEGDVMTPTPLVRDWLASIHAPKTDLVVLEDVGHLSMMAAPDAFLEALVAHVRPIARKQ